SAMLQRLQEYRKRLVKFSRTKWPSDDFAISMLFCIVLTNALIIMYPMFWVRQETITRVPVQTDSAPVDCETIGISAGKTALVVSFFMGAIWLIRWIYRRSSSTPIHRTVVKVESWWQTATEASERAIDLAIEKTVETAADALSIGRRGSQDDP